eukprot:CAMPEP_0196815690 /NCGR_PEP_ID=MMETSP1362-20130617/51262_1 /TAXON_ID=163516 /ORGANISM="Leptocylindrus danicus, Strain CCMP1856" /LENGTH=802 /DNA_ID=CAMNT_0042192739 /DNA_START=159 /DNA_END=2567 /DNA_ORIENTATION=+
MVSLEEKTEEGEKSTIPSATETFAVLSDSSTTDESGEDLLVSSVVETEQKELVDEAAADDSDESTEEEKDEVVDVAEDEVKVEAKEQENIENVGEELVDEATASSAVVVETEKEGKADPLIIEVAESKAPSGEVEDLLLIKSLEKEISEVMEDMDDDTCEVDVETGLSADPELCEDPGKLRQFMGNLRGVIGRTIRVVGGSGEIEEVEMEPVPEGEILEQGWEKRGNSSALRRNAEVWKFALKCVFKSLKPRSMKKKGATEEELEAARNEAALFIRDGLLRLGPTFVKLGQVVSTRTDVLPPAFTDVLKTLQDDVPGFSGKRAKDIISKELGKSCDEVFTDFSEEPLAAASLGQVHTAYYKGKKVAIKVQRANLKELFDVDLKNLKKLAVLLDKFDPKTDGADRDWVSIYEESERLLYLEIDYLNEVANGERFAKDFADTPWVRVPKFYREVSTPRVLVMEFVESFKLTNLEKVDSLGLNRELLAKRTADAFLKQIIETGYFHCDPHPGNLCVDTKGNLVYYDFGMMDELKPNVRSGFRKFCTALFAGGPMISDLELSKEAKKLVDGVEEAGVLARGADRLAVEKLAKYFMRSFKNKQLGKTSGNIKETVGTDLQTLTENNVFRFPSTFTFIFRSFASIDGIGKGLDAEYDIGKLAQPFVEKFTDVQKGYTSEADKNFRVFTKATGLNLPDINTAVTSPKKIAYVEETLRSMESGNLKIRVRSLENEKALERMALTQSRMEKVMLASLFLNVAGVAARPFVSVFGLGGAALFGFQAFMANASIKKFDKTQAKFVSTKFEGDK